MFLDFASRFNFHRNVCQFRVRIQKLIVLKKTKLKPSSKLILSVILVSAGLVAFAGSLILLLRFVFGISLSKFASTFVLAFPNLSSRLILLTFIGPLYLFDFTTLISTIFLYFLPLRSCADLRIYCRKKLYMHFEIIIKLRMLNFHAIIILALFQNSFS